MRTADTLFIASMSMLLGSQITQRDGAWLAMGLAVVGLLISAGIRIYEHYQRKKLTHG